MMVASIGAKYMSLAAIWPWNMVTLKLPLERVTTGGAEGGGARRLWWIGTTFPTHTKWRSQAPSLYVFCGYV